MTSLRHLFLPLLMALGFSGLVPPAASAATSVDYGADIQSKMRPGAFAWYDDLMNDAPTEIVVSIALQRIYIYQSGILVGTAAISTGRPGHRTPLGDFEILQKNKWHRSNIYSNAPMPFMQRLTWDGIALHAGVNPGYPASHGCIRMPYAFAQRLFELTSLGTKVTVLDTPGDYAPEQSAPVYLAVQDWGGLIRRDTDVTVQIVPAERFSMLGSKRKAERRDAPRLAYNFDFLARF